MELSNQLKTWLLGKPPSIVDHGEIQKSQAFFVECLENSPTVEIALQRFHADNLRHAFDANQPRDDDGKWTSGGSVNDDYLDKLQEPRLTDVARGAWNLVSTGLDISSTKQHFKHAFEDINGILSDKRTGRSVFAELTGFADIGQLIGLEAE